ncbi:MAG: hypothetical protein IJW63_07735 [Lachnospiraceae bacterium]|nr:hypothetical protein [Lachnospiraceae bacterium]
MAEIFYGYHVVTERPMYLGQHIIFDANNRSGVYKRVMSKKAVVEDIYQNPQKYQNTELEYPVVSGDIEVAEIIKSYV